MRAHIAAIGLFLVLFLCASTAFTQDYYDFGFSRQQSVAVLSDDGQPFAFPWAGGINSVRLSSIDLNGDGHKDLVAFEKHGNRLLPFVRHSADAATFAYAPQYVCNFPTLHDWTILKDYDGDGLEDIFTYGLAGITVYRNVSDVSGLHFQLVTEQIQSFYYHDSSNLYTSPDDYLAVEDLDGDGDLDLLNFWLLGKYVHLHRNYSKELYGDASHFAFRLESECWGHFEESGESNHIVLNSACGQRTEPSRHVGSTLLARDLTGNGLPDLVLGDVDYPNLILLRNGGTVDDALMVSQDTLFPNADQPVWLYSMPVVSFIDLDEDGIDEFVASPSDPALEKSRDQQSVWLYRYDLNSQDYSLDTKGFLQNEMIDVGSGAHPVLYDWNGDGLLDLFVASHGSYDTSLFVDGFLQSSFSAAISYYINIGTASSPKFQLVTCDFGDLRRYNLQRIHPAFADLNGDGRVDMLCGLKDGTVRLFLNTAAPSLLPLFQAPEQLSEVNVGAFATPQLFDLDNDGLLDLLVGNRRGMISYYHRNAGEELSFSLITEELGGVDVRDADISFFGYCVPFFYRHHDGATRLFCGNEQGDIAYYDQIDGNLDGEFRLRDAFLVEGEGSALHPIKEGLRSAPALADLNGDGFPEMLVGNYAGGVSYFDGSVGPPVGAFSNALDLPTLSLSPNPASESVRIHSQPNGNVFQLIITDLNGRIMVDRPHLGEAEIDVSGWAPGLYLVTLRSRSHVQTAKLVVVKH